MLKEHFSEIKLPTSNSEEKVSTAEVDIRTFSSSCGQANNTYSGSVRVPHNVIKIRNQFESGV